MIINTLLELTDQFNKSGRTNQFGKPPFEGVFQLWRSNHRKKLTYSNNRKVNLRGSIKTDCLMLSQNFLDTRRNREKSPRLKPETSKYGQIGWYVTMPFLTLTSQAEQNLELHQ